MGTDAPLFASPPSYPPMNLPKRSPDAVMEFPDSQAAIDGILDVWLPRIVKSNQILTAALMRVRDYYLAGTPPLAAQRVLAEIESALEKAAQAHDGL
jgi:hypothetical protein